MAALTSGVLTEWRATILVRETAYLTREAREEIDRRICADPAALVGVSDREIEASAKRHAYELEPEAVVARKSKAEEDRRVSVRPAPDLMTQLSVLLPMADGIAVYAALKKHADSVVGQDDRNHAQVMTDTLVERVTGRAVAEPTPIALNVVLSERSLFGVDDSAADVHGYGPIPATVARLLVADSVSPEGDTASTMRKLYARPSDGALVAMESRARAFPTTLAQFIRMRDQRCRTPYCGAPIVEVDHATPHRRHGPTSAVNADGTCVLHNRAKEAPGWFYDVKMVDGVRVIDVITPTARRHRSVAPPAIGHQPPGRSGVETSLIQILAAASLWMANAQSGDAVLGCSSWRSATSLSVQTRGFVWLSGSVSRSWVSSPAWAMRLLDAPRRREPCGVGGPPSTMRRGRCRRRPSVVRAPAKTTPSVHCWAARRRGWTRCRRPATRPPVTSLIPRSPWPAASVPSASSDVASVAFRRQRLGPDVSGCGRDCARRGRG